MIRVKFRHPVTRAHRSVAVASEAEVVMVRERVRQLRLALRLGTLSESDVLHELRRLSPNRRGRRTLLEAAGPWLDRVAPATAEGAGKALRTGILASLAPLPLESLDAAALATWTTNVSRIYRDSSILAAWRVLCAIVRHAISRRWIEVLPWGDWRPPRTLDPTPRPRESCSSPDDVARLLEAAAELDRESRARIVDLEARMACALLLGLRLGELAGLRFSDFDRGRGTVRIERQYDGAPVKGRTGATLRAPAMLFDLVDRVRAQLERVSIYAHDGPVFPHLLNSRPGKPAHSCGDVLSPDEVRRVVRHAGLPNPERWTVHSLRASFVRLELQASGSVAHAMIRARHRSLRATQAYARELVAGDPLEPAWTLPAAPAVPRLPS